MQKNVFTKNMHCRIRPLLKETKKNFLDCRRVKENLACFLFHYFARDAVKLLLEVFFFKGSLVEIFAEKVAKGNSVQNDPNFPAKSLSIYTKIFP